MNPVRNPRRSTSPAYFLGRHASAWLEAQSRKGARPPSRSDSDLARG